MFRSVHPLNHQTVLVPWKPIGARLISPINQEDSIWSVGSNSKGLHHFAIHQQEAKFRLPLPPLSLVDNPGSVKRGWTRSYPRSIQISLGWGRVSRFVGWRGLWISNPAYIWFTVGAAACNFAADTRPVSPEIIVWPGSAENRSNVAGYSSVWLQVRITRLPSKDSLLSFSSARGGWWMGWIGEPVCAKCLHLKVLLSRVFQVE